ncbi:MAG: type II toxin-antitoxin system Phd/YefM family antitoxin [Acidobacteriaceae bacterium]|nr:type II toxin-antitoxin system Phd/YefM family antitoxin [Acidobacteriaceae bacterium]
MLNIAEDICSMTNFKRRTSEVVRRLRRTGRAVVLTTNGKADVVVQDAVSYQKLLDRLQVYENRKGAIESEAGLPDDSIV